jgi:hypothetical protein
MVMPFDPHWVALHSDEVSLSTSDVTRGYMTQLPGAHIMAQRQNMNDKELDPQ